MRVKDSEKSGLKSNIQKTKIMAPNPVTSWQIEVGKVETVTDFIFLPPKSLWTVTAAMKLRCLLLGGKAMTNLDSILKSRIITLPRKICIDKAIMFFPVVMYECESWIIKKAEC